MFADMGFLSFALELHPVTTAPAPDVQGIRLLVPVGSQPFFFCFPLISQLPLWFPLVPANLPLLLKVLKFVTFCKHCPNLSKLLKFANVAKNANIAKFVKFGNMCLDRQILLKF